MDFLFLQWSLNFQALTSLEALQPQCVFLICHSVTAVRQTKRRLSLRFICNNNHLSLMSQSGLWFSLEGDSSAAVVCNYNGVQMNSWPLSVTELFVSLVQAKSPLSRSLKTWRWSWGRTCTWAVSIWARVRSRALHGNGRPTRAILRDWWDFRTGVCSTTSPTLTQSPTWRFRWRFPVWKQRGSTSASSNQKRSFSLRVFLSLY